MGNSVKAFWFRITWAGPRGERTETCVYTGTGLAAVLDAIATAQRGRLAYTPQAPRIRRISAIAPPALDTAFKGMLDAVLRLENTDRTET